MRFAELDAVTVDGYGTLVRLLDPVPSLVRSLAKRGLDREPGARRLGVRSRGRLLPAGGGARARPRFAGPAPLRLHTRLPRRGRRRPRGGVVRGRLHGVDPVRGNSRCDRDAGGTPWPWARPGGRFQLGCRARRAPGATRRRPLVLRGRDQRGSRRGQAGPGRASIWRSNGCGSSPHGHSTSATRTRTSRERRRPGCGSHRRRSRPRSRAGRDGPAQRQAHCLGDPRGGARPARLREPRGRREAAEGRRLPVLDRRRRTRPVRHHPRRRPGDHAAGVVAARTAAAAGVGADPGRLW